MKKAAKQGSAKSGSKGASGDLLPKLNFSSYVSSLKVTEAEADEDLSGIPTVMKWGILGLICLLAFSIRLFAVVRYESVIHEFDPYFNFRTTKYLAHEGYLEFLNWFDDRGWYPLGRTIGGTIYPGLMLTAALFHWVANFLYFTINIRHVCVFLAPIFSANAALSSYFLTTEVTKRSAAGLMAAAFTAVVPSYISRSVGGSYDNEGVAIFALIFCFYLWIKAVHTGSMMWSCFCALSYYYMVAAWGGYVFIINVIPIYTVIMVVGGRYSARLYTAYTIFYSLGSLMAMTVPFVGFNVVQQAECAASHGVFVGIQVYALIHYLFTVVDGKVLRRVFTLLAMGVVALVALALIALQLMGTMTWSGRSLTLLDPTYASKFLPIIASVSEHQPTTWTSFFFDLHILVPLAPVGLFFLFSNVTDGGIFVILYGTLSWYFAGVMVRLMLTLAPIACILAAIGLSSLLTRFSALLKSSDMFDFSVAGSTAAKPVAGGANSPAKGDKAAAAAAAADKNKSGAPLSPSLSIIIILAASMMLMMFSYHATYVSSMAYSSPSIVIDAGRTPDGRRVMYDDYREAYFWLRQNTDENAKILSWWDYGYQMSAMANRTVLVDNNTWNNTHIATVGRALASTEEEAYPIMESLDVDYVLVIFGGMTGYSSDDINKFLWPVRIGSGVFPNDMPSERDFYSSGGNFDIGPGGSPKLLNCVAYKLCYHRFSEMHTEYGKPAGYDRARQREVGNKDITLTTMEEAFTSEHWIVRIYKVLPRANLEATPSLKAKGGKKGGKKGKKNSKKSSKKSRKTASAAVEEDDEDVGQQRRQEAKYVGCFVSEAAFGSGRMYEGGGTGANYNLALHHAKTKGSKYFALARSVADGHSFAFEELDMNAAQTRGGGCERPCLDMDNEVCGCMDNECTGPIPAGEEHNRRWAVYEVL
jgi:dolichyl-diphosphooligosaccharide--protein glycosyltransferase